jgi:hypothetical protein
MTTKDYNVTFKVCNNYLLSAMRARGNNLTCK